METNEELKKEVITSARVILVAIFICAVATIITITWTASSVVKSLKK